jgi:hypothetical protein
MRRVANKYDPSAVGMWHPSIGTLEGGQRPACCDASSHDLA